jgi:hypothetical protein
MALQQEAVIIPKNQPQPHWTYHVTTGLMSTPKGQAFKYGYSGRRGWKNQPILEGVKNYGAIPEGWYQMTRIFNDVNGTGAASIVLKPIRGTVMFGRTGFRIHGDSSKHPGDASDGCIILGIWTDRHKIWNSGVHLLEVKR